MIQTLIPTVVGTLVGAVLGFAGATRLDRRRFERDREVRQADDLEAGVSELVDAVTRVLTEAGTYAVLNRHRRANNVDVLRPAQICYG